jgi:DNA-binding CsgD family transcriptional regulator
MGQGDGAGEFRCHPECLKRSYWRRVLLEIEEDILGMRTGQLTELILAVEHAEAEGWHPDRPRPATPVGRKKALELYLRGSDDWTIDSTLGFPHGATAKVVADSHVHPRAREVVAAHLGGKSPSRISRDCGVAIGTVLGILESIGEEPHRLRDLAKSGDLNRAIQRRYEEGWSYKRIAEHLGIEESKVRNRLQYLRRKGRIEGELRAQANVHRRKRRGPAE